MKVVIISDNKQSKDVDTYSEQALGPAYVAASTKQAGHEVTLYHKFPTIEELLDFDVVGFSVNSQDVPQVLETAKQLKKEKNNLITVVAGGPHVSGEFFESCLGKTDAFNRPLLASHYIDFAIEKEGEFQFPAMLKHIKDNVKFYKNHFVKPASYPIIQTTGRIKDLDSLPFPTEFRNPKTFLQPNEKGGKSFLIPIIESRGCPGQKGEACKFCSSEASWGKQIRYRSGNNILEEVEEVVETYSLDRNNTRVLFDGLELMTNKTHVNNLMATFENTPYELISCGDIRLATPKTLETMKRAGYGTVLWGIESLDENILEKYKQGLKLQEIEKSLEESHKKGIRNIALLMLGFPEETEESILSWSRRLRNLPLDSVRVSIATPFPGTQLRKELLSKGYKLESYSSRYDTSYLVYNHPTINKGQMENLREEIIHYISS